jgi:hypothetical protein
MRGQAPKPSLACPEPQATFSRDPAVMEETHANVTVLDPGKGCVLPCEWGRHLGKGGTGSS